MNHTPLGLACRIEALETRTHLSGEIDHTFATDGLLNVHSANGTAITQGVMAVQADGKIVVAGALRSGGTAVIRRYLTNGSPDTGFGTNGIKTISNAKAYTIDRITVLSDGRIQVTGQQSFRLTKTGQLDSTFGGGDGVQPSILASNRREGDYVFADGSYLELSNDANTFGSRFQLFRYKADGSIDKDFGGGKGYFDLNKYGGSYARSVTVDAAGRIYVSFQSKLDGNGFSHVSVLRLTSAGAVDGTWGTAGLATDPDTSLSLASALAVLADGRVVVNGRTESENGVSQVELVIFAKDGRSDVQTNVGPFGQFYPGQIVQAKSGAIFVGGTYYSDVDFQGDFQNAFAAVVSVDSNFNAKTSFTPDHDGVGGFHVNNFYMSTGFGSLSLTPAGDLMVLGRDALDQDYNDDSGPRTDLVRLDGPSKFNKVSSTFSNGVLTVNGSGQADTMRAETTDSSAFSFRDSNVVYYDYGDEVFSPDVVVIPKDQATVTRAIFNLNGGDDKLDAQNLDVPVSVSAGSGNDTVYGSLSKPNTLRGGDGDDSLTGGVANDYLFGDAGTDSLEGNGGTDHLFP